MEKPKLSGSAVFMYSTMALTAAAAAVCLGIYYLKVTGSGAVLWTGIVSFMILYHFGMRIMMGNVTKKFRWGYDRFWCRELGFEKKLYRLLRVKKWKGKVLTFEPENFDVRHRSLEQLAETMTKSELDHWINEVISLTSLLFALLWGCFPAFLITAVFAMIFDMQFIIVQRYNRPIVVRLIKKRESLRAGV